MTAKRKTSLRMAPTITLIIVIASVATSRAQSRARASLSVTDSDKARIIQSMLMNELSLSGEDRTKIVKPGRSINPCKNSEASVRTEYISSKNITAVLLPKISCINFIILGPEEIERKSQEGIQYLTFDKFEVKGLKAEVRLATVHKKGTFFSMSGVTSEFRKVSGRWIGKQTGGYGGMT